MANTSESPMAEKPSLKDWSPEELGHHCVEAGWPRYRGEQIAAWVYARGVEDPSQMTDLPAALRDAVAARWQFRALELVEAQRSLDGTIKGRLRGDDGAEIESVLIPEGDRNTLCVSTQVGCPLACSFCATGALGFRRNLRVAEIVDQVCRMRELLPSGERITNLVFMGMGEPLLNRRAVVRAIRIFQSPRGFALGPRKITVSTAGVVPQIEALLDEVDVNLAVSLHAPTDSQRDELVPLNRSFPLDALLGALRKSRHFSRRRPIFFEYTLIAGKNDTAADAARLATRLRGLPAKVNLIPMNAHPGSPAGPPAPEVIDAFAENLIRRGLRATVRRPRGTDIAAACGQLSNRSFQGSPVSERRRREREVQTKTGNSSAKAARSSSQAESAQQNAPTDGGIV